LMKALVTLSRVVFGRFSLCALSAAVVGAFSGMVIGLAVLERPESTLGGVEALRVGLLLGAVGWVIILLVVGLWLHYGVRDIALYALGSSLLTAVISTYACLVIATAELFPIVGLVIGLLIGALLCWICPTRFTEWGHFFGR
jgi:hypothetical protein